MGRKGGESERERERAKERERESEREREREKACNHLKKLLTEALALT